MSTVAYIYVLKCPLSQEVRYVGKTTNLTERYKNHTNKHRDRGTAKRAWLEDLRCRRLKPVLEVIEEVSKASGPSREKYHINRYRALGASLTNCGDGESIGNHTAFKKGETRQKIRAVVALNKEAKVVASFLSVSAAARDLQTGASTIYAALARKRERLCKGLVWMWLDEYVLASEARVAEIVAEATTPRPNSGQFFAGCSSPRRRPVLMLDKYSLKVLKEYGSATEAMMEHKSRSISQALCGKNKTACGYIWQYKEENK